MSPATPAVSLSSLGAWLLKASPHHAPVDEWAQTRFVSVRTRCVRPTYRTGLVRPGQPVLFWLSGGHPERPPGIYAHGHTTGPARLEGDAGLVMPVRLDPIEPRVARADLLADHVLRHLEVLRMPAGSNPSWVSVDQFCALRRAFPQLDPGPD